MKDHHFKLTSIDHKNSLHINNNYANQYTNTRVTTQPNSDVVLTENSQYPTINTNQIILHTEVSEDDSKKMLHHNKNNIFALKKSRAEAEKREEYEDSVWAREINSIILYLNLIIRV